MMNNKKIKTFFFDNILYFIFSSYFLYIFSFYFFSENISAFISISNLELGYILGGDSSTYIQGAKNINNFELPTGKATSYLGYIIYLAIFQYFKLDLTYVVLSQIFLTFLSSLCIYEITKKISSHLVATFILSIYLFYLPLQMWNFYILADTIFICLIIFIIYFFIFFKKKYFPLLFFLIIFYITLKPHGIILIPSLAMSLLVWLYLQNRLKLFYLLILVLVFLFFPILSLLNLYLENESIVNSIQNKGIIWGYENKNNFLEYNLPDKIDNDLISLLIFLKKNIVTFTIASFKKIWFFNFRIRPYYSDFHNYYIIIFDLIYWPAAVFGLFKLNNSNNNIGIILMYFLVIFFTIAVGLSWADWDSRFSLYILPLILIFAGVGFYNIKIFNIKRLLK